MVRKGLSDCTGGSRKKPQGTEGVPKPINESSSVSTHFHPESDGSGDPDGGSLSLSGEREESWLSGYLASQILDPSGPYFRPGTESVLMAASLEQGRIVFRFAREMLDDDPAYKFSDSYVRSAITHIETRTSIRLISSNAKGAMGLVRCPYVLADEPGSWEVTGGTLMHDAIQTAMGKPGSALKAIYTGTLAPSTGGWWHDLVAEGSGDGVYVQVSPGRSQAMGSVAGDSEDESPDQHLRRFQEAASHESGMLRGGIPG